jgi:ABC-2 type transport system ATP-binding protein
MTERTGIAAVRARGVGRVYRKTRRSPEVVALDGIDLDLAEGEVHGLLGPNGAGKTTLVKIISTVLLPTSGSVEVLGHDVTREPRAVRRLVGVVFGGERGLYTRVSARRNILFWGAMYGLRGRELRQRADGLLDRVGLADRADVPVETFSRGMKQRLHLARGLVHDPRVVFLDEPTAGMDPVAAREIRGLVRELQGERRSILLATHDMAEATALCQRVTLIDRGKVLLSERTAVASSALGSRLCVDFDSEDPALIAAVRDLPFVAELEGRGEAGGQWRCLPRVDSDVRPLLQWLVEHDVLSARRSEPSLEEVYLRMVGSRGLVI